MAENRLAPFDEISDTHASRLPDVYRVRRDTWVRIRYIPSAIYEINELAKHIKTEFR
jgi:hypothetical protein